MDLKDYSKGIRKVALIRGFLFLDHRIEPDTQTMFFISEAKRNSEADPSFTMGWKFDDGHYQILTSAQYLELYVAGFTFVDSLYVMEDSINTKIDAGIFTSTDQVWNEWCENFPLIN